jgi:hypothetical protein
VAKTSAKGGPMNAVQQEKVVKGVRLDLSPADHRRLNELVNDCGLTMLSYARMALFERMKGDEEGRK